MTLNLRPRDRTASLGTWVAIAVVVALRFEATAAELVLDGQLRHVRATAESEWSDFPQQPESSGLKLEFRAARNDKEATLRLRQQDVKQIWTIRLNGTILGVLREDENDTIAYYPIPIGGLKAENVLTIEQASRIADDIRIGEVTIVDQSINGFLSQATVELTVLEKAATGESKPVPCRITVVDARGALQTLGAASDKEHAVRPGVIYCSAGRATFGLPAGTYTIYAGRGFEYGVASLQITLGRGDSVERQLTIHREVPTKGLISCDPHIHTLTYSGHGDATVDERVLTIAGEGIELPIATEHNRHADYDDAARRHDVRKHFTPVIGNEVTTALGHFNVFPIPSTAKIPGFSSRDGNAILDGIATTGAKAVILNHPRDIHSGFRPFDPERHLAANGDNSCGWLLRAGAMEVVNSGAQQTDVMRLFNDWFALLNRGVAFTPVGASDSHDVSRFIVGQARTYIRCSDDDVSNLNVNQAVDSFVNGRVLVSCGLMSDIVVNDRYGPGDLVPATEMLRVKLTVLGPSWTSAEKVVLYANGCKIQEFDIVDGGQAGVKWEKEITLRPWRHDVHLVAVATGPGVSALYWPIAKPYQPSSAVVRRQVIGSTGAVWIDGDRDGKRTAAKEYAVRLRKELPSAVDFVKSLASYDEAVAIQAAGLLSAEGRSVSDADLTEAAAKGGPQVTRGFRAFIESWKETEIARAKSR